MTEHTCDKVRYDYEATPEQFVCYRGGEVQTITTAKGLHLEDIRGDMTVEQSRSVASRGGVVFDLHSPITVDADRKYKRVDRV